MIKTLKNLLKQDKERYTVPRKVQDVIPVRRIWKDGIFQVGSRFSKTYQFTDINYLVASREDKEQMFLAYSELLNSLDSGATTKITINNRRLNRANFEQSILMPIDEFPRLGKIEAISNGLATLRSKKIHISLIVQSKSQLNAIYGKDVAEVIADNCSYKAILKASEPTTQEWCSKLVGTYDKKKVSSNYNADIMGVGKGQGTSSSTEEKRIIKPEEFAYLQDVVCVFPNGYKRLQKANYYEDSTFTSKM